MFNCLIVASWPPLFICGLYVEEPQRKSTSIEDDCLQLTSEQVSNLDAETICLALLTLSNDVIVGVQRFWLLNLLFTF